MFTRFAMLAIVLAAVCTPRSAEASRYFWQNVNNGRWDNADNWLDMDDPGNQDYPDGVGDEAHFTLAYTQPHTVTIPAAGVTVGAIYFDSHVITIDAAGSGKLRMQQATNLGAAAMRRVNAAPFGIDTIRAPIELRSHLTVTLDRAASWMNFVGTISAPSGLFGITKLGLGRMDLQGRNTYGGSTTVLQGQLHLNAAQGASVSGTLLTIGPRPTIDSFPEVVVSLPNQIEDQTAVEVKPGGLLTIRDQETIGSTSVAHGQIVVRSSSAVPAGLAIARLTMDGGMIESRDGGQLHLLGEVSVPSGSSAGAVIHRNTGGTGVLNLGSSDRTFDVRRGAGATDLYIGIPIVAPGPAGLIKTGDGVLSFGLGNTYGGATRVEQGELTVAADGTSALRGPVYVGLGGPGPAVLHLVSNQSILDTVPVVIGAYGTVDLRAPQPETIGALSVAQGGRLRLRTGPDGTAATLIAATLTTRGGRIEMHDASSLSVNGVVDLSSTSAVDPALIAGGRLSLGGARAILVGDGSADTDALISSIIVGSATQGVTKQGDGTLALTANNTYGGATTIAAGRLNINGSQPSSPVVVTGGILGGKGKTGPVNVGGGGRVSPGDRVGRLSTGSIAYTAGAVHALLVEGANAGEYGQLAVTGAVTLGGAKLESGTRVTTLPPEASFLIIDNDGNDAVVGTFEGLAEGAEVEIGGVIYAITYHGGDGNDVVIKGVEPASHTYYLAEGATGAFFDDDVLIANPNHAPALVGLTFLREGGATLDVQRVIPAQSRVTIHVDEIEGLEDVSASVKVDSVDSLLPLIVERSMFWDASYYSGHTANAVTKPEKQWTFAEGSQGGFFDTYILIANANDAPATVTLTFLRENETPVVKTVDVGRFTRKTIHTGEYEELRNRAFGIAVDATEPVIAERAMYFANQPGRIWAGGHANTGIVAPSRSWFHAEGATGSFFSTFILLSNPQETQAKVGVKFLLDTGEVVERPKTLEPKQRVTINPATEDPRLANAAVSTVVQSDVPIVSERSMYWEGDAKPFGEGHNSSGVTETGLRWGLAEGRIGSDRNFVTYILLANPVAATANVRITYLREDGAPIVKEYQVAPTSRFNVDVKTAVPELQNSSFGAIIEVLNDVPIAVERSVYWDANGAFWAGGTNALATRLPPIE